MRIRSKWLPSAFAGTHLRINMSPIRPIGPIHPDNSQHLVLRQPANYQNVAICNADVTSRPSAVATGGAV